MSTDIAQYLDMERATYADFVAKSSYHNEDFTLMESAELVVGSYVLHEAYDYEKWLFGGIHIGQSAVALDYGCGPGRMLLRLSRLFKRVDGVDISPDVLEVARRRCARLSSLPVLVVTDGESLPHEFENAYDIAYSVICLQHICVHTVRHRILTALYRALKPGGVLTFQMGYGTGHAAGVGYEENFTAAASTNGAADVTVLHPGEIGADLAEIGFVNAAYALTPTGPSDLHASWIFVRAIKPGQGSSAIRPNRDDWAASGFQPLMRDDVAVERARACQAHPFALLAHSRQLQHQNRALENHNGELERLGHELERHTGDLEEHKRQLESRTIELGGHLDSITRYAETAEQQLRRVSIADRPRLRQLIAHLVDQATTSDLRIGILGAGAHTNSLFETTDIRRIPSLFLFDNAPDRWGRDMHGLAVRRPSEIRSLSLDAIVVSSLAFQEEMVSQLAAMEMPTMRIIRCYPERADHTTETGLSGRPVTTTKDDLMTDTLAPPSPLQIYRGYTEADVRLLQTFSVSHRRPEPGFIVDFLGVRTRVSSLANSQRLCEGVIDIPVPGDYHAEAVEYVGLLKSVSSARGQFIALELGAGWGPWLVAGAKAAHMRGLETIRLYGIEADPQHFEFMIQHFIDNQIDPAAHHLMKVAVGVERGRARWPKIVDAANDWGSRPARVDAGAMNEQDASYLGALLNDYIDVTILPAHEILEQEERWDLVHVDVQGWERLICETAISQLNDRVAYLIIGTHSRKLDGDLVDLFHREGWILEHEKPSQFTFVPGARVLESMNQADGTQVWRNPRLTDGIARE